MNEPALKIQTGTRETREGIDLPKKTGIVNKSLTRVTGHLLGMTEHLLEMTGHLSEMTGLLAGRTEDIGGRREDIPGMTELLKMTGALGEIDNVKTGKYVQIFNMQ